MLAWLTVTLTEEVRSQKIDDLPVLATHRSGTSAMLSSKVNGPVGEFLSDAPFFGLSLWMELKVANCACASGWGCLMNLDLSLLGGLQLMQVRSSGKNSWTP